MLGFIGLGDHGVADGSAAAQRRQSGHRMAAAMGELCPS
jgi:hypothetical protein